MSFYFLGKGPASKSLLLRAHIVKSYFDDFQIMEDNDCDDVHFLKSALNTLRSGGVLQSGEVSMNCFYGGAVLRFLALRVAREKGSFILKGEPELFKRPLDELKSLLSQLGCDVKFQTNSLKIKSQGWQVTGDALTVPVNRSSQFASGVLLNSWDLPKDLFVSLEGDFVSYSYFQMTIHFLKSLGMKIEENKREYIVPAHQKPKQLFYQPEPDMSCLFSISALASVKQDEASSESQAVFTQWPEDSLQADSIFPEILEKMGVRVKKENSCLKISSQSVLRSIEYNIKNCPDLFPVLATLCAVAKGTSRLDGASHLRYKESNRIESVAKLLQLVGISVKILKDGLIIKGGELKKTVDCCFDPQKDHRLAMAGAVLKQFGCAINILDPNVVNKSFPNFWSLMKISP